MMNVKVVIPRVTLASLSKAPKIPPKVDIVKDEKPEASKLLISQEYDEYIQMVNSIKSKRTEEIIGRNYF